MTDSDLLDGADEIAQFLFGDRSKRRRVYFLIDKGELPAFKLGGRLTARKSALTKRFEELEASTPGGAL